MNARLVAKSEKTLEIEFEDENETLLNLLKSKLLQNPNVESATYVMGHPHLDHPRLVVVARSGKPDQHLRAAAKDLRAEFDAFETALVNHRG